MYKQKLFTPAFMYKENVSSPNLAWLSEMLLVTILELYELHHPILTSLTSSNIWHLPSGTRLRHYGKIHHAFFMGKSTISTGPFSMSQTVNLPEAISVYPPFSYKVGPPNDS